ncbi:MAG: helix-turn-helix domain-containing protein [Actinomycetota bacterium]
MEHEAFVAALQPLLDATGALIVPAADAGPGDLTLSLNGVSVHVRVPNLDGALQRLVGIVEQELGAPLADLAREDKQQAVARLHALGAFNLRKAVEDVAGELGVSRFTVYNYLDRIDASS